MPNWDLAKQRYDTGQLTKETTPGRPSWEYSQKTLFPDIPEPPKESFASKSWSAIKRISSLGGRGLWAGLGIISWPFERIEYTIATPLTGGAEKLGAELAWREGVKSPTEKETWQAVKTGLKTWMPGREIPEEAKTFNDFWGAYYKGMTGEEAPEWYKHVAGSGTSFLVTPAVFSKMLKVAGKPVKAISETGKLSLWQRAKLRARAKVGARVVKAEEIGKKLADEDINRIAKELSDQTGKHIGPAAVKQRLGQIIKGTQVVPGRKGGIVPATVYPKLQEAANPAIQEFRQNLSTLQRLGILPGEVYTSKLSRRRIAELVTKRAKVRSQLSKLEQRARFPGKQQQINKLRGQIDEITDTISTSYIQGGTQYFPRMYVTKEAGGRLSFLRRGKKIGATYAKRRKDISEEIRKAMGQIEEPAYPVVKRLIQEGSDIETAKLFEFATRQPGWTSRVWLPGMAKNPFPNEKSYGALKGLYANKQVYNDVTELTRIKGDFEKLYDTAIGTWKLGKVVWNPATHFRNKFSNKILLDLSGMGYGEQAKYAMRAYQEFKVNSKEYQIAKQYFGRTTQIQGELLGELLKSTGSKSAKGLSGALDDVNSFVTKVSKKPSQLYQHEEFTNKFMKYLQARDQGKSVIEAVEEANKWLFDYAELSKWEKQIARRVMPFYTFPRKALPRVAEAAAKNPYTIAKYPMAAKTMTQYSLYKLNISDKDYKEMQKVLPEYMKNGSYILMPYRDKNGDLRFFDWTYLVPWGELYEMSERGLLKTGITNPIFQLVADISRNKSGWTNREIYKETDTTSEKAVKSMQYIWQSLVPSLAYKGIYWDKIYNAATGKPSKTGKIPSIPETLAHTIFGLRTQAIDLELQKRLKAYESRTKMQEIRGKMIDIMQRRASGNITDEEFLRLRTQYLEQAKTMAKEIK
jgi:hypothetical protein